MADSAVPVTGGTGYNVDTRTESINGDHRQVVVIGDPVTGAQVASVDANGRLVVAQNGASVASTASTSFTATGSYTTPCATAGNATFYFYPTASANTVTAGCVVIFEQSYDNSQWGPILVSRSDTGVAATTFTLPAITNATVLAFNVALQGPNWVRARITTFSGTVAMSIVADVGGGQFTPVVAVAGSPTVTLGAGSAAVGTVSGPAITKGTQGTSGLTVQDLKDAGRNPVNWYTNVPVLATATDTLLSLTGTRSGAAVAATTGFTVTTGKTFRVQQMFCTYIATATAGYVQVRLRYAPGTSVAVGSPVLASAYVGAGTPATANSVGQSEVTIPDGLEIPSGAGFGITALGLSAATATAVGYVAVSLIGYEY